MRLHQWTSARPRKEIFWALALVCSVPFIAVADEHGNVRIAAQAANKLEATIFSYDGQDFVRVKTTLLTADGKSALNTKLEHDNPAYKALIQKRSYSGVATVFGHNYDANYAPLTSDDGKLTGALFVAVAK
ncbi:MAG TPA: Cache 3/Cache 2 fusion domain-containing protein [Longimicrobiales bacterium]|nr:Cache 3/Cache 2 fusion domain-containing protein [Longimicrobiales bacterium]